MAAPTTTLDKRGETIRDMFAGVAPRYDLLNHLLSGSLDRRWRRRAAEALEARRGERILDLCAGTGDQALALAPSGARVVASDFCLPMLVQARPKLRRVAAPAPLPMAGDALALPYADGAFDGATVSFGLRNVADLDRALGELARVTRPAGRLVVLEFMVPVRQPLRSLYLLYFRHVLPAIGRLLSPRGSAYSYLPSSVLEFPQRQAFTDRMRQAGFEDARWRSLALGIVGLYQGTRQRLS